MFLSKLTHFQRSLSQAQTKPVAGPLLISPCKALLSTVQVISGLAGLIIFGAIYLFSLCINQPFGRKPCLEFRDLLVFGSMSFVYSIANFGTLGLFGKQIELGLA